MTRNPMIPSSRMETPIIPMIPMIHYDKKPYDNKSFLASIQFVLPFGVLIGKWVAYGSLQNRFRVPESFFFKTPKSISSKHQQRYSYNLNIHVYTYIYIKYIYIHT